jgi:hypothetical protein
MGKRHRLHTTDNFISLLQVKHYISSEQNMEYNFEPLEELAEELVNSMSKTYHQKMIKVTKKMKVYHL